MNYYKVLKVPAGEYFIQEGVMPEYFAIKRVADNPLWGKYIDWWQKQFKGTLYTGVANKYYGFKGRTSDVRNAIINKELPEGCIELTLEQWDKIINKTMEENDKEIIGWKLKEDCEQYKQAALNIVNQSKFYNFAEGYNFSTNSSNESDLKKAGVLEIWFEPVYKEEFKVGDWVTFYLEYNQRTYTDKIKEWACHSYCILEGGLEPFKHLLRKATPEEIKAAQTLQFGGYDVTFEKVSSGVRITCNGETGTFSQIEKIYTTVLKKENMIFGSQEVKQIVYSDDTYWLSEHLKAKPTSIKIGCTTGTWEEFAAIYEKAKSML